MHDYDNKIWFRLLKVVYVGFYILAFIILGVFVSESWPGEYCSWNFDYTQRLCESTGSIGGVIGEIVIAVPGIWLFLLVVKRIFFYIAFGEKFLRLPKKLFD